MVSSAAPISIAASSSGVRATQFVRSLLASMISDLAIACFGVACRKYPDRLITLQQGIRVTEKNQP